jgi:hypothetical protein
LECPAPTPDDLDRRMGGEANTGVDGEPTDENATLDDFEWVEQ